MEGQNIEYKEQWYDDHLKTVCAFANTQGGRLFIGITDKEIPVGVKDLSKLLEVLPNKIRNILGIVPDLNIENKSGKDILVISVLHSNIPISYEGRYYSRSGSNTFELKGPSLTHFLISSTGKGWDEYVEENAKIDDLDPETMRRYRLLAKDRLPMISTVDDPKEMLERLHLMDNGKLTKAAVLLFAKDPRKFILQAYLKIGRFKEDTHIIGSDEIEGNLFQQIDKAMEVLRTKYLKVEFRTGGIHRQEIWEYPHDALKEAVTNALVHRDYLDSAHTQMRIYDDQLWLWNAGGLPPGIRIEELSTKHNSKPRNKLLAEVLFKASVIEAWGIGTVNMIGLCERQGLPSPEFKEEQGGFSLRFYKDRFNEDALRKMGLNARQVKAVLYVKEKGSITNEQYRKHLQISERTATRDLADLRELDILEQIGTTGKGTQYILKTPNRRQ